MDAVAAAVSWNKAAFLHERALRRGSTPGFEDAASRADAERRAASWRKLMAGDETLFEARLQSAGLDRDAFLRLLSQVKDTEAQLEDRAWEGVLQALAEGRHEGEPLPSPLDIPADGGEGLPFSGFVTPFLRIGAARLRAGFSALRARHPRVPLDPNVETLLLLELERTLRGLATRVLVLELNVARMLGQLPGNTPQERFWYFSTVCFRERRAVLAVLEEYPVLARLLSTALERWAATSLEFIGRLSADAGRIEEVFLGGRELGVLEAVQLGEGDLHRGGRSVVLLRFSSGLKLVYKPKSLAAERRFQELLDGLNAEGLRHPHRLLAVEDRGEYGWVEFVDATACADAGAVRRFYWRQGSLLAVLHLLSAVDFHYENLIAAGEHPVLVDLEALFHHRPPNERGGDALGLAHGVLNRSVLCVGLLPMFVMGVPGRSGIDLSGLGGDAGQLTPHPVPTVEDAHQDTMRLVRKVGRLPGSNNRPRIGDVLAEPAGFTRDIVQGYEETYGLLARRKDAAVPRIDAFADVEVRHIARATQRYASLLEESHHPDFLRDGLERDKILDHLWLEVAVMPELGRLVAHEHADLLMGDIPMFTARPGQRHLYSSRGECIPDFFPSDGLTEVRERLAAMGDEDRAMQVSFIRQSMVSLDRSRRVRARAAEGARAEPASRAELVSAAVSIGERLAAQAIRGASDVTWIGLTLASVEQERWTLMPLGTDLYDGVGGLALFFAHLAARTGRSDFEALARAALEPVRRRWRSPGTPLDGVGVFAGRGTGVYVLAQLAALWDEPALMDELLTGLPVLEHLIDADGSFDVLSGSAGCAVALLGAYRQRADERLLAAARRCGEHLVAKAAPAPGGGVGWASAAGGLPLAGFSHGAAGIAWALLELSAATGEPRFAEVAREAIRYERSLFDPEQGNWRDLRPREGVPDAPAESAMVAWCHGAAGVALGRLLSLRHLDGAECRDELSIALETTLREGFGGNHSLCHGDLGNAEVLHLAGELLGEPRWSQAARERVAAVLREARGAGFLCGLPGGNEAPGLMVGLAGIGLELLRFESPERVPPVVALGAALAPGV